jgi:porin
VAQAEDFFQREYLTGWSEQREQWEEQGIEFEAVYTAEAWRNARGGVKRASVFLDNLDVTFTLDAEKLWAWNGGTFFLYFLRTHGGSPSENVGDTQAISNIDAPDTAKLYEAWYQQRFGAEGSSSVLFGLYDLNSEFDVIPSAGLFILSSHGIGPDFSQSGKNGPSIFPTAALGLRLHSPLGKRGYLMAGAWDGVAGDPDDHHGTQVIIDTRDGLLMSLEAGLLIGNENDDERPDAKLALGHWRYTSEFPDLLDPAVEREGNQGYYVLGEYAVSREAAGAKQGLSVFARIGHAEEHINPITHYQGLGLVYTGLFEGRDEDRLGLAVGRIENGARYRQALGLDARETHFELTYRAPLLPWLAVQPDVQYVVNPGTDPALDDAVVFGIRMEAAL